MLRHIWHICDLALEVQQGEAARAPVLGQKRLCRSLRASRRAFHITKSYMKWSSRPPAPRLSAKPGRHKGAEDKIAAFETIRRRKLHKDDCKSAG